MTLPTGERRASARSAAAELGAVRARVRPGHQAEVIDISCVGALLDVSVRLLPGAAVEMQLEAGDRRTTVGGRVVRCDVARLSASAIGYRAAVAFDRCLPECVTAWPESPLPEGEPSRALRRVEPTRTGA